MKFPISLYRGRSTITNLTRFLQFTWNVDEKRYVDVMFSDFSKAFYKMEYNKLVTKLERYGMLNDFIFLFRCYLMQRIQLVQYNDYKSSLYEAYSGVPQRSNLESPLFLFFIPDSYWYWISNNCLKLYSAVNCRNYCIDYKTILLLFTAGVKRITNLEKCLVITCTGKISQIIYDNFIKQKVKVSSSSDLVIELDSKSNYNIHIIKIVKEASKILWFIMRYCKSFLNFCALPWKEQIGLLIFYMLFNL